MKILVAAVPRSGSHAYCSTLPVQNNLFECMNIEDMLLPRLDNEMIDFSVCNQIFLDSLDKHNWKLAWHNKPIINSKHTMLDFDTNMQKIQTKQMPSLKEFLISHEKRWKNIQQLDSWCIKLIKYQGVPLHILQEIISKADQIIILRRRNKLDQALSIIKSKMTQLWHNKEGEKIVANAGNIDYNLFKNVCVDIKSNDTWVENVFKSVKSKFIYYEDLDLSNSHYIKNKINLTYNLEICKKIIKEELYEI